MGLPSGMPRFIKQPRLLARAAFLQSTGRFDSLRPFRSFDPALAAAPEPVEGASYRQSEILHRKVASYAIFC